MIAFVIAMVIFLVLIFIGIDIVFSFVLAGAIYLTWVSTSPIDISVVASRGITLVGESYTILAIPLFIFAACLLNETGLTNRLVAFAVALVGHVRGGLGHAVIVANLGMAGISGSATADAAGIGKAMIPSLQRSGYAPASAAALSAAAATLGPIVPPSIALVLYASLSGASLGGLLLAGIVPGLLMVIFLMVSLLLSPAARATTRVKFSWRRLGSTAQSGVLAILMPLIILGGMFLGFYTPTEGAAMAVVYSILVGTVVLRSLGIKQFRRAVTETVIMSGAILLVVMGANGLSWLLTADGVGLALAPFFTPFQATPGVTLLIIAAVALILGTAMEEVTMLILFTPILAPVVVHLGIDPIQFGIVFVTAVMIGLITPPVGISMFIAASIAKVTVGQFSRAVVGPFLALVGVLVVLCLWPPATTWLPNLVLGR